MRRVILLTALLFIVSLGFSNSQTKKKQKGQVQFSKVIKKIEKKFDVSITYETDISFQMTKSQAEKVIKMQTVEKALAETVKSKNIMFKKIRDDYYVLSRNEKKSFETSEGNINNNIKERVITGVVTDQDGEPIPGATVLLEKTTIATMTDLEGKFSLSIPTETGTLIISYIGYQTTKITISEETYYSITLKTDEFGLDEIIVSGVAGNTPTKKLTVTVEKVGGEQLNKAPASSTSSALQGKVAGVIVKSGSGDPSSGSSIKLRGVSSIRGSSSPMIIVDGVIVNTSLADISAADIKSVEIVKGAAAASLYGSKAANGVIVVTTKRGKDIKDKFRITVRNEYGITKLANKLELATHHPYQLADDNDEYPFTKYANVVYSENGDVETGIPTPTIEGFADQPYYTIRDHQSIFFKQGKYYTNYISLGKNTENLNMFLSFENYHNTGIIFETEGYGRKNFRFNADVRLNKYFSLSTSNMYMLSHADNAGGGFGNVLLVAPDIDLFAENADGTPYKIQHDTWSNSQNPLYPLNYRELTKDKNSYLSNFSLKLDLTNDLYFDAKYTFEKQNILDNDLKPLGYLYGSNSSEGYLSKANYTANSGNFQTTANYNKSIKDFTVKAKISYLFEDKIWDGFTATGKGFAVEGIPQFNYMTQDQSKNSSKNGEIISENVFGILDFDYKSKYLFSGLVRRDGSSLFGEDQRWHTYYRVAGAYRISEDIKIPGIQEFKLRAALGTAGNRPSFYDQYETYSVSNGKVYKYQLGNRELRPSKSTEKEFALDLQFLKKFNFRASWSETLSEDVILEVPLKSYLVGFITQVQNAATIESNSLEFSLNYKAISNKNTNLDFNLFYDRVRQKVIQIDIKDYYVGAFQVAEGENYGVIVGKKWLTSLADMEKQLSEEETISDYEINSEGYVIPAGTQGTVDEKPIALDADKDGNADKVVIADCNPDFNLNLTSTLSYKGFSIYMLWSWKKGGDIYNKRKQNLFVEYRAAEIDQSGKSQKKAIYYYSTFYDLSSINSYFVEDGTYIKLRELSLSYTYKLKSSFVKSVKISAIGRNLFTITKYSGYDPEVGSSSNFSYDNYGYPNFRTYTGSLQFIF